MSASSGGDTDSSSDSRHSPVEDTVTEESSDIDVVNLSSQLVSMGILSQDGKRKRKSCKRVRFTIPEEDSEEKSVNGLKRRKSPETNNYSKPKLKRVIRKTNSFDSDKTSGEREKISRESQPVAMVTVCRLSGGDEASTSTSVEISSGDYEPMMVDKNENCSLCTECESQDKLSQIEMRERTVSVPEKRATLRPLAKKRKVVVSKISYVKRAEFSKSKSPRKRKQKDVSSVKSKKRKIGTDDNSYRKFVPSKGVSIQRGSSIRTGRAGKLTVSNFQSRSLPRERFNSRSMSAKCETSRKRIQERLSKTSKKRQSLKRRYWKRRRSKAAKSKMQALKWETLKQDNQEKTKVEIMRKQAIKPLSRKEDMDVIPALRVPLLKFLTLKVAEKRNYGCCRRCCWIEWEDVYMEDIKEDYE